MKIITVLGARPQFIKASVVSRAIAKSKNLTELIIHTGQHFDANMSDVFFHELGMENPSYYLGVHGGKHGEMTGRMLMEVERVLLKEKPNVVLVYGDTNSTLAGALAAAKLHIPVAHVEAGLRSFNMQMPEEINRILTDQISDILFCPTATAVQNLNKEGFAQRPVKVLQVGDVMQDAALLFAEKATKPKNVHIPVRFILATLHRAENTDNPKRLKSIVSALNQLHETLAPVLFPLHPRTRKLINQQGLEVKVNMIDPVSYFDMIWLLDHTQLVLTDSGGVQKEAYFFGKTCVTMRDQTEWVELLEDRANVLVGADTEEIINAATRNIGRLVLDTQQLYGGGQASVKIVAELLKKGNL